MAGCAASGPAPGAAADHRGAPATRPANAAPSGQPSGPSIPTPIPAPAPGYGPGHPITGRLAGKLPTFIPHAGHVVALTFDAGANDAGVPSILRTLRRFHVAATFFITGDFARTYPAVAHQIAADGFRIGNHTMTHTYLTRLGDAGVRWQISAAVRAITQATGENPAPLFRFPYGDQDARTITIANRLGYVPVSWTVDTLGWEGASAGITVSEVESRVLAALRPGEIVLMHVGSSPDGSTLDAHALPRVVRELQARGYSFVTLGALAGQTGRAPRPVPVTTSTTGTGPDSPVR
jgi:peptidoglycan-N-acetylglucosamine deacetylase